MKLKKVFIDVDDVLNKFTMYVLSWMGCSSVSKVTYSDSAYNPTWKYDIVRAANNLLLGTGVKYTRKTFWDNTHRALWSTTPYSDEFLNIVRNCRILFGKSNVALLTSPIPDPECYAGKCEWIRSRCPDWLRKRHFIGRPKEFMASPNTLLIDDSDMNCSKFVAAGGSAILIPRPWNQLHGYNTQEYLDRVWDHIRLSLKLEVGMDYLPLELAAGLNRKSFDEINEQENVAVVNTLTPKEASG